MVTELGPIKMLIGNGRRESIDQNRDRELNIYRSGSCPPTVEGSLNAIEGTLNEDELRSDPAYLAYYYSNVNLNPRLPPPIVSKEDWRFSQRKSCFDSKKGENEKGEWVEKDGDGLIGLSLGRQKSFADIFQDDWNRSNHIAGPPSRPSSRNTFNDNVEPSRSSEAHLALHDAMGSIDSLHPSSKVRSVIGVQNNSIPASQTFASVLGSPLSRSNTPDPQLVARATTTSLLPVGVRLSNNEKNNINGSNSFNRTSAGLVESDDLVASLSGMSLSTVGPVDEALVAQSKLQKEIEVHEKFLFGMQGGLNIVKQNHFSKTSEQTYSNRLSGVQSTRTSYTDLTRKSGGLGDLGNSMPRSNGQVELNRPTHSHANLHGKAPFVSFVGSPGGSPAPYQNFNSANAAFTSYGLGGFPTDPGASPTAIHGIDSMALGGFSLGQTLTGGADLQNFNKPGNHMAGTPHQMLRVDPLYSQYLRSAEYPAGNYNDLSTEGGYTRNSYLDLLEIQKQYLGALLQPHKQSDIPFIGKSGRLNNGYYGNTSFGLMHTGSPVFTASHGGSSSPLRLGEQSMHFASGVKNLAGGVMGSWHSDTGGNMNGSFVSSLLEEFKSNKTKNYELSDIAGHVVEFSADQYGSRFIQLKLEMATTEEKDMVYDEIIPHAFSLMTDVFGNYVIQKFFEHGSAAQRSELADQLRGHVLTLSLQMYGCRVIQKAIEVVDLDQQIKMVAELVGHVIRLVRDQNGNHVIQKCIECIPEDAIQFIVSSFYDQVVLLSTHPYGCRVIQRVLEHCHDATTQQIMVDEIFQSVCMLAQDQYGNYVVQHVLEHGKPHERSAIIKKLAGQIVQMSQQKFASNVVEKCLTFGGPVERQILVNKMLGTTDENEPLQAMMKDQFANYVVQKVLETCDDRQRELILSRIKVHLNALKKYTYGKHIVARVEKLVAAGERRIGQQ